MDHFIDYRDKKFADDGREEGGKLGGWVACLHSVLFYHIGLSEQTCLTFIQIMLSLFA